MYYKIHPLLLHLNLFATSPNQIGDAQSKALNRALHLILAPITQCTLISTVTKGHKIWALGIEMVK